jgi:hypothetical protein
LSKANHRLARLTDHYFPAFDSFKTRKMFFYDPKFTNKNNLMWLMAYIRLPEHLEQYYREYERGEMPSDPVAYCVIPGLMDPSLVTSGEGHTCTIFSHYYTRGEA